MKRHLFSVALAVLAVALSTGAASASLIAYESFEDYASSTQVVGQNGGAGFSGAWAVDAGRTAEVLVQGSGLSYSSGAVSLAGGNRALAYTATEAGIVQLASRQFAAQTGAGPIYFSMLYNNTANVGGKGDDFLQVGYDTAALTAPRVSVMDRNNELQIRPTTNAANSVGTGVTSTPGQTFLLVLKAEKTGASSTYNSLSVYVNPTSYQEAQNTVGATSVVDSGLNMSASAFLEVRKAFLENGDTFVMDELRVASTFAEALSSTTLARYTFPTNTNVETGPGYAPTTTAPGVAATSIMDTAGNVTMTIESFTYATAPVLRIDPDGSSASLAQAVTNGKFVEFSLGAVGPTLLDLDEVTFEAARGGSGTPRGWGLFSSLDGFTTAIASADIPTVRPTVTPFSIPLTGDEFSGVSAVTFRLYVYSTGDGATVEFDNITVFGTTQVIPEPASLSLLGLGALALVRRRRAA